jgi:hypothetical protein
MDPCTYPATSGPHLVPPYTLLGGPENMKVIFDRFAALMGDGATDNQSNSRAWAAHNLRVATNAATIDNLAQLNLLVSAQSGDTSAQQTTSPIRTGTGDTVASSAYPANRATDQASAAIAAGIAESVQTNVTTQISALTEQITALGGTITTALQALADSNALIASALSALAPKAA